MSLLEQVLNVDGKVVFTQASTVCRSSIKSANGSDCCASRTTSVALSCYDGNLYIRRGVGGDIQQVINRCNTYRENIVRPGHQIVRVLLLKITQMMYCSGIVLLSRIYDAP
jgi:hypothetical protein